jgi:hypothetical protein
MRYNYASDVSVKMLVFEAKLEGTKQQYERLDEAIRTARLFAILALDTGWITKALASMS